MLLWKVYFLSCAIKRLCSLERKTKSWAFFEIFWFFCVFFHLTGKLSQLQEINWRLSRNKIKKRNCLCHGDTAIKVSVPLTVPHKNITKPNISGNVEGWPSYVASNKHHYFYIVVKGTKSTTFVTRYIYIYTYTCLYTGIHAYNLYQCREHTFYEQSISVFL